MLVYTGFIGSGSFWIAIQESGFCMSAVKESQKGQYLVMGSRWKDSLFQLFLLEGWAMPLSNDVIPVNIFFP